MALKTVSRKETVLSRREVEGLIADGRTIVIIDNKVLKLDAWLKFHPGGDKAIRHMVGRDATDEVNALHSPEARQRMNAFQVGRIEGPWRNFIPPIQGGRFRPYLKEATDLPLDDDDDHVSSSSDSTRPSSPIFDVEDYKSEGVRRRRSDCTSVSSVSSMSPLEVSDSHHKFQPKPFFLDARTQEEIVLDVAKYPSLDQECQDSIVRKYRALNRRIHAEGLYNCPYWAYGVECIRYFILAALSATAFRWGWFSLSAVFLGALWHQLAFTVHDAGHMGITHNFQVDSTIGMFVASFMGGLSAGWWKHNHNVHHIVTNSPEHDPDIEHLPFFAVSHRFLTSLRSSYYERVMSYDAIAKVLVPFQQYLYYPILLLGRFNLCRLSWQHLLLAQGPRNGAAWWHRYFELVGLASFWLWYGYFVIYCSIPTNGARLAFLMISHIITAPLHLQITLSHFAMSTTDLGPHESFPQKMLRTTMDVDCPPWLDFFHGGLQFQAIHHLYPRIPRHNLRKTQKLVQEFCNEVDIPYALYGFVDGNKEAIGRLGDVARQAKILAECQKVCAAEGLGVLSDHH